ncbi:MAG: VOC family protein [Acidobacteriia bacterium]|nr:VOC family protein [Terriglobia bacterium]
MSAGKILGIGGVFFKSDQKSDLNQWYARHLGLQPNEYNAVVFDWRSTDGGEHKTVWSIFPRTSTYYEGAFMINYIVDDLDAILARLEAEGVRIDPKRESDAAIGRFAWIYDSDGNRIELWEPPASR